MEIQTVEVGKTSSRLKILKEKVDVLHVAEEINNTLRRCGLSPLSQKEAYRFVKKVVANHNKTTDEIASFMGIKRQ